MVTTTLVDLLMPLARRMLPAVELSDGMTAPPCPDPRFEALRWPIENDEGGGWRLDTSLGGIVRTASECGLNISCLGSDRADMGRWNCRMEGDVRGMASSGDTPEEAAARCLVALVEAEGKVAIYPAP